MKDDKNGLCQLPPLGNKSCSLRTLNKVMIEKSLIKYK